MAGLEFPSGATWRDSARNPKFFIVDYRACFPLLALLFNIAWSTFIIAVLAVIFFSALNYYGFTIPVFLRWLRTVLAGPYKPAVPWWMRR